MLIGLYFYRDFFTGSLDAIPYMVNARNVLYYYTDEI